MNLLVNEWFFHDLSLANGAVAFQETSQMVIELVSSETKLVIPAKRRWIRKAYQLKDIEFPQARLVSKLFHSVLNDSERTILTSQEEMEAVPEECYDGVPEEDVYLVKAYLCSGADLLVTTDVTLFDSLAAPGGVQCMMRSEFLLQRQL